MNDLSRSTGENVEDSGTDGLVAILTVRVLGFITLPSLDVFLFLWPFPWAVTESGDVSL